MKYVLKALYSEGHIRNTEHIIATQINMPVTSHPFFSILTVSVIVQWVLGLYNAVNLSYNLGSTRYLRARASSSSLNCWCNFTDKTSVFNLHFLFQITSGFCILFRYKGICHYDFTLHQFSLMGLLSLIPKW